MVTTILLDNNMPRPRRPSRDLSGQSGNPTHTFNQYYHDLMPIQDVDELMINADRLIQQHVGKGFSPENYRKFKLDMKNAADRRGLEGVQFFLTNFLLRGSGLGVIGPRENIAKAISTFITEDNDTIRLTPHQRALKLMVEHYGYHVYIIN